MSWDPEPRVLPTTSLPCRIRARSGAPSHDTFNREFRLLDPGAFTEAFLGWVKGVRNKVPGDIVAIDGKTLRSSMAEGKPALHLVRPRGTPAPPAR